MIQGWFREQASYTESITPWDLEAQLQHYSLAGNLDWLPNVSSVPIINEMSQRSRYKLITTDKGGGGGAVISKRDSGGGIKVVNPNWDPRY